MGDADPTMVAALVAAVLALAEVAKALGKLVYSKLTKNGEGAIQRNILTTLAEQGTLLQAQGALLKDVSDTLAEIVTRQADLYRWHEPEIEPGVKVWWIRKSFEDTVVKLGNDMGKIAKAIENQTAAIVDINKDLEVLRRDYHEMAIRDKYRRRRTVTSGAYPKVGPK